MPSSSSKRKRPLGALSSPSFPSSSSSARRTILVVGLSPACFETEVLMVWPKKKQPKGIRLVWLNSGDPPPKLPAGWGWDEVHRCSVDALGDMKCTASWGDLFVVMGAGTSVQDFASLKQDTESMYPFDKELLQASSDADCFNREGVLIMEPLCVQTLRFMAGLRKAFLEHTLPSFHTWLRAHSSSVVGLLTFNIDSLEFLALDPSLHDRVVQFHGNIQQLTTVESLAMPYHSRPIADRHPPAWSDPDVLERVACPLTPLSAPVLDMGAKEFMGCRAVGVTRSHRQLLLDREVIEASKKMCRGEDAQLSPVSVARANSLVKDKMKQLYLGNCVFTGEHNDGKLSKCATAFIKGFVAGDTEFHKVEAELRTINKQRGVGPEHLRHILEEQQHKRAKKEEKEMEEKKKEEGGDAPLQQQQQHQEAVPT